MKMFEPGKWYALFNQQGECVKTVYDKSYRRLLGCEDAEYSNTMEVWLDSFHREDRDRILAHVREVLAPHPEGMDYDIEYRMKTKRGYRWFHDFATCERRPDGTVIRCNGVIFDIQHIYDQKNETLARAVAANQRNAILHQILKSGPWSYLFDRDGHIFKSTISPECAAVLQNDITEAIEWLKIVHPEEQDAVRNAVKAAIADPTGKTEFDAEYRVRTGDDGWVWIHSAGRVIRHADGGGELYGVCVDVSETVKKERARRRELESALAMAQAANRAKTMFLNNMSHDIRTPMNAIIGFTGLAAGHLDSRSLVKDYLGKIAQASDHLLSLINDVLDMARIESGKMALSEKVESLPEIVHSIRNIVQNQIADKQLDFFIDCCEVYDENIVCDKLRLSQVLLNVLSNSIKYTPTGGMVSLRICELTKDLAGGETDAPVYRGRYLFTFKDTGVGMSPEFLGEIFDPFSRAKNTTASGIQGTGLGMAITKSIVDMMGGQIKVSSDVGKGTEVKIVFDFALGAEVATNPKIEALSGMKALVADDDINSCRSVASTLREVGMLPEWCTSGKEAVIRAKDAFQQGESFKVFIIDWLMPDMNGIETVRRIRHEIGPETPIVILTAYDWSDIEKEAREAGVTAFVAKPLFASELKKVLVEQIVGIDSSAGNEEAVGPAAAAIKTDGAIKRVLLVEDNEINREIAAAILTEHGFEIDTAVDGREAVAKVKSANTAGSAAPYDIVLMDIQMPVMDGYQATRALRAAGFTLPIVALSANAFAEDVAASLEAGMNGHLSKPIKVKELLDCIASF